MGIMFVGANIFGLGLIFAIQYLLDVPPLGAPPLLPSNIFMFGMIFVAFCILLFYRGEYKRLNNEELVANNDSDKNKVSPSHEEYIVDNVMSN